MKLSKENFEKLDENFLYRSNPHKWKEWKDVDDPYWCRNWTFRVEKREDGRAFMVDTYWMMYRIEVTDENIDKFEKVFDFREVKEISSDVADEYDPRDVFYVPLGGGGIRFGMKIFVRKNAKRDVQRLIEKKKEEIEELKRKLDLAKKELEELISMERDKCQ